MARKIFSSPNFIIFVVTCAAFTDIFLCDLIVTSLPNLVRDRAGVPYDKVAIWMSGMMSSFGIGQMLALPIVGWFTDNCKNRKLPFTCGLITLCLATSGFFVATAAPLMVAGRFMQGCSAAFIMSAGMAFVTETVPEERGPSAVSWVASAQGVGEITGIVAGGVLYDLGGHQALFITAMVLVVYDIVLRLLVRSPSPEKASLAADAENQATSETSPLVPGRENETPRLRPAMIELLRNKDFILTVFASFFIYFIRQALETDLPFTLQRRYGWTPSLTSAAMLGFMAPAVISPLFSRIIVRYGARVLFTSCFAAVTVVLAGTAFANDDSLASKICVCIAIVLLGGFTQTLFVTSITACTKIGEWTRHSPLFGPKGAPGQAFSLIILAASAGVSCGPLWFAILNNVTSWTVRYLTMAGFSAVMGVVMCFSWKDWN